MLTTVLILSGVAAFILIMLHFLMEAIPGRTRRSIFFAVTVSPDFPATAEGLAFVRRFRRELRFHSLTAAVLGALAATVSLLWAPHAVVLIVLIPVFWQLGGTVVALQHVRRGVLPHRVQPPRVREATLRPRSETERFGGGLLILLALPLAMIACSGWYLHANWARIPDRFATHWNVVGAADGWSNRTFMGVYGPLLLALPLYLTCAATLWMMRSARRVAASGSAGAREVRFRRTWQIAIAATASLITGVTCGLAVVLPFRGTSDMPTPMLVFIIGGNLLWALGLTWMAVRQGQGGSHLPAPLPLSDALSNEPIGDGTPDEAWRGGVIYYNPDDPALFVEKRFGIGWDFNWGNKLAWVCLAALLLPGIVVVVAIILTTQPGH